MKVKDAIKLVGSLSNPSKMPGRAWGIPAHYCNRGGKLKAVPGSICSSCYATRHRYAFGSVQAAYLHRYQEYLATPGPIWVEAMTAMITSKCRNTPFFRWFDSGDLQSVDMLGKIVEICKQTQQVNFWLSTRERKVLHLYLEDSNLPPNLVVRVAADLVDGDIPPPVGEIDTTCTVSSVSSKDEWAELVDASKDSSQTRYCPAPLQDNHCQDCRACWDRSVKNVVYKKH